MDHSEFVEKWNSRKILLHIDKSLAFRAVEAGVLPGGYRAAQRFNSWLWILGLIASVPLMIWYIWWVGLIVLLISLALPGALKATAAQGVRDQLIENKQFYKFAQENNLFRITERTRG